MSCVVRGALMEMEGQLPRPGVWVRSDVGTLQRGSTAGLLESVSVILNGGLLSCFGLC